MKVSLAASAALLSLSLCAGASSGVFETGQGGAFAQAVEATRETLLRDSYARLGEREKRLTRDVVAGLVDGAWQLSHAARYLGAPAFSSNREIIGRPGLYNPDNIYRSALLDPQGEYRISGVRGTHTQLTFQFVDAYPLLDLNRDLLVIDLEHHGVAPGDAFEFHVGGERRPGLWWPMPAGARAVLTRQTFNDWSARPSRLAIERLDRHWPQVVEGDRLALAARYLRKMTVLWVQGYLQDLQKLPPNSLSPLQASAEKDGGLRGQQSLVGRYQLQPGEALVISARASDAGYQSIQLGNYWFVTPNPVDHQVSLNASQAHVDADGLIRYVISLDDPGVANWLDPAGNRQGYIFIRWQGLRTPLTAADQPTIQLVPRDELMRHLPEDTRKCNRQQRTRQLHDRAQLPGWQSY